MRGEKHLVSYVFLIVSITTVLISVSCSNGKITVKDDPNSVISYSSEDSSESSSEFSFTSEESNFSFPAASETSPSASAASVTEGEPAIIITTEGSVETSLESNDITATAKTLIGLPFADGGASPSEGFDTSGFIYYVLKQNGYVNCPRVLSGQSTMGTAVDNIDNLIPGDLVFFSESGTAAEFGGIYIGNGVMIYSPQPGQNVKEVQIFGNYYSEHFFKAVRIL